MRKICLLLSLFLIIGLGFAQQDPQFSQFVFTKQFNNAGYTGVEGLTRATLIHRSQWLGYSGVDGGGAPTTQLLSLTYPLKVLGAPMVNSGVGIDVVNDQLGPVKNLNAKLSYSYHLRFSNGGILGLGLNGGFYSQQIDAGILRAIDDDDATVSALGDRQIVPDFGFGAWYQTKKYYAGVSINHLNGAKMEFSKDKSSASMKVQQHLYFTGGYNLQVGPIIVLTPNVIVQTDLKETNFTYGVIGSYNKYKYWGGIYLRQSIVEQAIGASGKKLNNDDVSIIFGIGLLDDNVLRVGYGIDVVTSGVQAKSNTSHEIMVSYVLPFGVDVKAPPLRTPRYRHEN